MSDKVFCLKQYKNFYFIHIDIEYLMVTTKTMAELLSVSLVEYEELITSYGAIKTWCGYIFPHKEEAIKFATYLNETYLVMLKLTGKI